MPRTIPLKTVRGLPICREIARYSGGLEGANVIGRRVVETDLWKFTDWDIAIVAGFAKKAPSVPLMEMVVEWFDKVGRIPRAKPAALIARIAYNTKGIFKQIFEKLHTVDFPNHLAITEVLHVSSKLTCATTPFLKKCEKVICNSNITFINDINNILLAYDTCAVPPALCTHLLNTAIKLINVHRVHDMWNIKELVRHASTKFPPHDLSTLCWTLSRNIGNIIKKGKNNENQLGMHDEILKSMLHIKAFEQLNDALDHYSSLVARQGHNFAVWSNKFNSSECSRLLTYMSKSRYTDGFNKVKSLALILSRKNRISHVPRGELVSIISYLGFLKKYSKVMISFVNRLDATKVILELPDVVILLETLVGYSESLNATIYAKGAGDGFVNGAYTTKNWFSDIESFSVAAKWNVLLCAFQHPKKNSDLSPNIPIPVVSSIVSRALKHAVEPETLHREVLKILCKVIYIAAKLRLGTDAVPVLVLRRVENSLSQQCLDPSRQSPSFTIGLLFAVEIIWPLEERVFLERVGKLLFNPFLKKRLTKLGKKDLASAIIVFRNYPTLLNELSNVISAARWDPEMVFNFGYDILNAYADISHKPRHAHFINKHIYNPLAASPEAAQMSALQKWRTLLDESSDPFSQLREVSFGKIR